MVRVGPQGTPQAGRAGAGTEAMPHAGAMGYFSLFQSKPREQPNIKKAEEDNQHPHLTPWRKASTASGGFREPSATAVRGAGDSVTVPRVLVVHWVLAPSSTAAI